MTTGTILAAEPRKRAISTVVWLPLVLFCLGHFFVDLYSAALGVLQPLLLDQFRLNYTQAGILGGVLVFSSSVMQPLYGYLSDRYHSRLFSGLAPAVAGMFISSLGWAPNYWILLLMVSLGGAGIASFHPQAAANATASVRSNRGRAMAVFISSGALGLAFGPAFFSALTAARGLRGATLAMIPGVAIAAFLLIFMRGRAIQMRAGSAFQWAPIRAVWRPMLVLYLLVFIRSIVQITFTQFLPLFLHSQRGYSVRLASYSLSVYLLGGAIGGFAGGTLADRFGGRRVIIASMIGSFPFLVLFLFTHGLSSAIGLFLSGLILLCTNPVNVVMAQELVPAQAGTVSALMMGFAWGTAGLIFIPLTGWMSDLFSMQVAFTGLIGFPLIGFLLSLKLPK